MPVSRVFCETPVKKSDDASKAAVVKPTKEPRQRTRRQISVVPESARAPSPQRVRPKSDATRDDRQEKKTPLPQDRTLNAETPATQAGIAPDEPPATGGAMDQEDPTRPQQQAVPPEELVELPGAGRDFKNRFDAAQGRIRNQSQDADELQTLLDQAITLLESVSQHPAIRDYNANKRKLDEIEQRLGYGAYPQ
jgi:hypothetical protein